MATSPERIEACRIASLSATGPRTTGGKDVSRRNSTSHGLSGSGKVVPEQDRAEVDRRAAGYVRDYNVRTDTGLDVARQMAVMSVRLERCASHEAKAIAHARRHAIDRHDDARQDEADRLFAALGESPRVTLRRLMRMPEGIDLLVLAWKNLRVELTREQPRWTTWHREKAEHLTGNRLDQDPFTEIGDLSETIIGSLGKDGRADRAALAGMIGRIDAEIAALESHRVMLDHEMLELDRLEAPDRALVEDSKAASLARRYEAEASRRSFKLLAQLKAVEAEAAERPPVAATPTPVAPSSPNGSFRVPPRQEPYAPLGGFAGPIAVDNLGEIGQEGGFTTTVGGGFGSHPARG